MKIWQLSYPHNLQHVTAPDLKRTDDKVKIKITSINDNDPLSDGVVEKNAEALKEYFNTADTTENFLKEIRPLIAYTHLLDYFTYYFQTY